MTIIKDKRKRNVLLLLLALISGIFIPKPTIAKASIISAQNNLSMKCHRKNLDFFKYSVSGEIVNEGIQGNINTNGGKYVFLTFDDGPSTTVTPEILEILKNENVKATFFLLGNNIEISDKTRAIVKSMYEDGHAIGNHTYTHKYNHIYPNNTTNVENYLSEIELTDKAIKAVLGDAYTSRIIRMPGGAMSRRYYKDSNLSAFNNVMNTMNINSIDWNASICDASNQKLTSSQLVEATKKSIGNKEFVVLLMHDTYGKEETAKALPEIIHFLKESGYEFRIIN